MVHAKDAGHGKDATSPFSVFDFETLVHSALPLDSPGFMKRSQALSVIAIKTRGALVYESDVGIEKFGAYFVPSPVFRFFIKRSTPKGWQASSECRPSIISLSW